MASGDLARNDLARPMKRPAMVWSPLHQLLLSDAESSLPRSDGAEAVGEYGEGYLCLGIQANPRSEWADRHVVQVPSQAKLNGCLCRQVTAVQPERGKKLQGALTMRANLPCSGVPDEKVSNWCGCNGGGGGGGASDCPSQAAVSPSCCASPRRARFWAWEDDDAISAIKLLVQQIRGCTGPV
ncbi:hypothetical protein L1987_15269 [Smallanthus sonchifolius]|uniref:Uncharacterized protein n=1 Tax=Smallanthus sonchifolius TaxID=185202 RepID=A0ACB9J5L8_9ASTR|nr:hypothetical protein L1987_15269 [Smallanthus sonchifolius]